ncbi:hypothetical protein WG907_16985 [Sphingobium sp. AN558]|uniref:hypothetical protein n=1 Tax=Sphingobium sp. AN558 TaxID=3133442 RepID=UPI0030C181FF
MLARDALTGGTLPLLSLPSITPDGWRLDLSFRRFMTCEQGIFTLEGNRLARKHGIKLRQWFLRVGRRARRDVSRLINGRGHKQAVRWLRKLRTWLGRLDRDIGRKIAGRSA